MSIEERREELNQRAERAKMRIATQLDNLADVIRGEIEFAIPNCNGKIEVRAHDMRGFNIGVRDNENGFVFGIVTDLYLWNRIKYDSDANRPVTIYELRLQKGSAGGISMQEQNHLLADRVMGLLAGWMLDETPFLNEIESVLMAVRETTNAFTNEYRELCEEENRECVRQDNLEIDHTIDDFEVGVNYVNRANANQYFEITQCGNVKVTIRGNFFWRNPRAGRNEYWTSKVCSLRELAEYIRKNGWEVATPEALAALQK